MKLVQTFWMEPLAGKQAIPLGGWLHGRYHMMSWLLSCLLLRRNHPNLELELVTDSSGQRLLIDTFDLPYTSSRTSLDQFSTPIKSNHWAAKLIYSYSSHQEPFINIDSDFFALSPIPDRILNSQLISQNIELGQAMSLYKIVLDDVKKHLPYVPTFVKSSDPVFSINAGIFGGHCVEVIQEFAQEINTFFTVNQSSFNKLKYSSGINTLVEQYFFSAFATSKGVPIEGLLSPVYSTDYAHLSQFETIPGAANYLHATLGAKKNPETTELLELKLSLLFPDEYISLIKKLSDLNVFSEKDGIPKKNVGGTRTLKETSISQAEIREVNTFPRTKFLRKHLSDLVSAKTRNSTLKFSLTENLVKRLIKSIEGYERRFYAFAKKQDSITARCVLQDKLKKIRLVDELMVVPEDQALRWSAKLSGNFNLLSSRWNWVHIADESVMTQVRVREVINFEDYYQMLLLRNSSDTGIIEYLLDGVEMILLASIRRQIPLYEVVNTLKSYYAETADQQNFDEVMNQTVLGKIRKLGNKGIIQLYKPNN